MDVELTDEQLLQWKPRMGMLSVSEKIEQAEILKRQANLLFKRGDIKKALPVYAKVSTRSSQFSPRHLMLSAANCHTCVYMLLLLCRCLRT